MDWSNERYVRVYTRDTADDLVLSWEAFSLWPLLLRKADRAGVIATNHAARGIAALVRWPLEVVERALPELLADGRIAECHEPCGYVIPNYIKAQEATSSDAQRKREERERRSSRANKSVTKRDTSSRNVKNSHVESQAVTNGHDESLRAVPIRSEPFLSVPDQSVDSAQPPLRLVDEPRSGHQDAIAAFDGYFRRTHDGAKPTWNGKNAKLMQGLLAKHGLPEIQRRIGILENHPPKFPPAPWDLGAFVQHFDKLATVDRSSMSATDVAIAIARGDIQ